jgi:basic amino acid/polyamine antiporter, APA family
MKSPLPTEPAPADVSQQPRQQLTLFDSTCIIVGIIIGTAIYKVAPMVAGGATHALGVLGLWVAGGLLSLAGALCYAELATAYPREGGDFVYLTRAYGSWAGYLFAWADLMILQPGTIAAIAFAFATYAQVVFPTPGLSAASGQILYAAAAVLILTAINIFGVARGKWTQNLLTTLKVVGILAIFGVAMAGPRQPLTPTPAGEFSGAGFNLAMILVLFAYGGWSEIAYVAAEVKNPRRNILRALLLGIGLTTVLYVLINVAFLATLGYAKMKASEAVVADTIATAWPNLAGQLASRLISALICLSALGAINGLIFTRARIAYAMGQEYAWFRFLGGWSGRFGTPVKALVTKCVLSLIVILLAKSFDKSLLYVTSVTWLFFLATGCGVFVLRRNEPDLERPYRIIGHPWTTLVFCASCLFLIYSAVTYDKVGTLVSLGMLLAGLPIYWFSRRQTQ